MRSLLPLCVLSVLLMASAANAGDAVLGTDIPDTLTPRFECSDAKTVEELITGVRNAFSLEEAEQILRRPVGEILSADDAKDQEIVGKGAEHARENGLFTLDSRIEEKLPEIVETFGHKCYGSVPKHTLYTKLRETTVGNSVLTVVGVLDGMNLGYTWVLDTNVVEPAPGSKDAKELADLRDMMSAFQKFMEQEEKKPADDDNPPVTHE